MLYVIKGDCSRCYYDDHDYDDDDFDDVVDENKDERVRGWIWIGQMYMCLYVHELS